MYTKTKFPKKRIQKWADALRSGKYKQTRMTLEDDKGFCCLGVACKLFVPNHPKAGNYLKGSMPYTWNGAPKWLEFISGDMNNKLGKSLTVCNDSTKLSFDEIADLIELVYIHEAV